MDTKRICSVCGKPLTPGTPEGLCPECLLKAGLGTGVDIGPDTGGKAPRFTPPKIEELAAKFPQLEILEFIGQGGMGAVYKARQKQLDRVVALKILPPQAGGPAFAERFTREARALAKLNHPHIVTLYEFGQSDGLFYFLMEFVDGVNLRQLLTNSRVSPREALAIVPQICEALQFAHDSGIVHRDIKPENVLLDKKGLVKIADFGVAKMIAESLTEAAEKSTAAAAPGELTEAGSTLGTPQYMAPEQIKNPTEVDHRADIYSLGVVFYQMLTGELPSGKIEPPSHKVQIDVRLDEVVLRALEKKPEMRFQQAGDVKTAVETIATTPQPPASETPPGFNHYKSPKWNFELDIPEGWNTLPPKNSPHELLRFGPAKEGNPLILSRGVQGISSFEQAPDKKDASLLILYRMPHNPETSLKSISDAAQETLAKAGFGNFVSTETTIGGKPARTLDFDRPGGDGIWSCRRYFIAEGTLAYILGFGTLDKAGIFETFDRMAKSFRLQPPPQPPPGFKHYEDPKWNFELDIPEGWNEFPPNLKNSLYELLRFASHENGRHLLIIFRKPHNPAKSHKDYSDEVQKILAEKRFGNFVSGETTIDGKPARTLDFDRPEDDGAWSCRHYFMAEGTLGYTLGFGTTDKAGMFETFDRMAKSFRFQPSGNVNKLKPFFPKTQTVAADEPKPESSSQKAEPELHSEGYTVRIEPVNPPKPARRFSVAGLIAFLPGIRAATKDPIRRFTILRAIFIAGFALAAIVNLIYTIMVVWRSTPELMQAVETGRLLRYFELIRAYSHLSVNWIAPYVFIALAITFPRRWIFITGSIFAIYEFLFYPLGPQYSEIQFGLGSMALINIARAMALAGFWVKPAKLHAEGYADRDEPANPHGMTRAIALLGILLAAIAILFSVHKTSVNARLRTASLVNEETPGVALNGPPFAAQLHQATVELAVVGDEPWTNPVCWYPDGQPSPKPFPTGGQEESAPDSGMIVKKLVFYIRNQSSNDVSVPICHVSDSTGVTSVWVPPHEDMPKGYFGLSLYYPSNTLTANLSIGVANGPWETVISMDHSYNSISAEGTGADNWSGSYESVTGKNGDVAVGCSYTTRSNWVSRIVYVNGSGHIVPISEVSDPGGFRDPATGTLLISSNEYSHIKQFLVQRRKCQWMEFNNISLQQGHRISVTAKVY
ncbi:MAG TPA: serine/threonine-protein kinase [Candidatus Sulfotelmatobacter sp.]|nr:serine/threonine-protein kinase [Candidatus Sulfotelmatobacter sp.]